jgi:hypothetical protein
MVNAQVKSHHTVWVRKRGWRRAIPVRYAMSGDALVTFGDGPLRSLADGDSTTVAVHEIAGGPPIASFAASIVEVRPADVDREAVLELLAHVSLGASLAEVNAKVDEICSSRRIVALVA